MKKYYYFKLWKLIYISISSPSSDMKKIRGVFKPLKRYFKCGKSNYPVLWVSKPSLIHICSRSVLWKDKYDTPRYEGDPYIWIHLFGFNLIWFWRWERYDIASTSDYWEQALWYLYYYDTYSQGLLDEPDIEKAKKTWPWQDHNANTTWEDKYLEL